MIPHRSSVYRDSPYPDLRLPSLLLTRYLFFLTRRPISRSNTHYVRRRIKGLQSLGTLFNSIEDQHLTNSLRLLNNLTPQNLREFAEQLQLALFPLIQSRVPRDYIVTENSPPPQFINEARKILLIFGPAIGIGDEVITFPTPSWIKSSNPAAEITVLTTYKGLWEQVACVDQILTYENYLTIIQAVRGEIEPGEFDLVMMVDFENPELYQAVISEGLIPRYIELSLGAQLLVAVDNDRKWIYRLHQPGVYFDNFYYGYGNLIQGLGLSQLMQERYSTIVSRNHWPSVDELQILVSPFTSKYDPSPLYWSRLLSSLIGTPPRRPVCILLDPGPNLTTLRFAEELARSVIPRSPAGITCEVAGDGRGLPLSDVFTELERSHVVICSDSFLAHLAPTLGCTTIVLASYGLEDWRVPFPRSFYLNAEDPLEEVSAAMRQILSHFDLHPAQDYRRPPITSAERQLTEVLFEFEGQWQQDGKANVPALLELYNCFIENRRKVLKKLPHWPEASRGLLRDFAYQEALPKFEEAMQLPDKYQCDVAVYLKHLSMTWQNTNLIKYLNFSIRKEEST